MWSHLTLLLHLDAFLYFLLKRLISAIVVALYFCCNMWCMLLTKLDMSKYYTTKMFLSANPCPIRIFFLFFSLCNCDKETPFFGLLSIVRTTTGWSVCQFLKHHLFLHVIIILFCFLSSHFWFVVVSQNFFQGVTPL